MVVRIKFGGCLSGTRRPAGRGLPLATVFVFIFLLLDQFLLSSTRLPRIVIATGGLSAHSRETGISQPDVLVSVDIGRVATRISKVHPISVLITVEVNPVIIRLL